MTGLPKWASPILGPISLRSVQERRTTISNDSGVIDGTTPPAFREDVDYYGKFFPRGCRGIMESINIYCIRTGAGTLTIRYAPYPGFGPVDSVTITPGSTWAWKSTAIEQIWNYDSLFIWVSACSDDVSWAYDAALPPDGHSSDDSGATWEDVAERPFIRIIFTGKTPGDMPVSGTINVIEIPSVTAQFAIEAGINVPTDTAVSIKTIEGAGTLLEAVLSFYTSVVPTKGTYPPAVHYALVLMVDGVFAWYFTNRQATQSDIATSGRNSCGEFLQSKVVDPAYDMSDLRLRMPIKFRRNLLLRAKHTAGEDVTVYGSLKANMIA